MTFRARIAIAAATAVALAVVLASVLGYFVVRGELRGQIDETLERRTASLSSVFGRDSASRTRSSSS
jgi:hypothetical protein